ncbi:MAG: pyridoxamine kinase [Clostridia bacterium]|nr:pyridoxamine kinase [Clostridia bacterium]
MKRIITVQDISCVGRCSLTVALPIISAMGVECGVIPTAVLSTHTAFSKFTFRDLTEEIPSITDAWKELSLGFDAVYTGYLGSERQIALVKDFVRDFGNKDGFVTWIDPVMADHGKLYHGFSEEFAGKMAELCTMADVVVPNLTEASFMLGIPYHEHYDEAYIRDILVRLTEKGTKAAALTGVELEEGKIGVYAYDSVNKKFFSYYNEKLPASYHGTGDVFSSCAFGAYMRGASLEDALSLAVDFTLECMKKTMADEDRRFYGVNFEEAFPMLISRLKELK